MISFGNFTKEDQTSTTFHQVSKGDSSRQFSLLQRVLVRHLGTFPFCISWLKEDAKSKMIKSCRIYCSMIVLFHPLHICSWRYNICSPNQPSLKCHRNQDTMTTTVTMYLKGYFADCANHGEKVTKLGKD